MVQAQQIQQQVQIIQKKVEPNPVPSSQMVQVGSKMMNVMVSESQPAPKAIVSSQIPASVQTISNQNVQEATPSSSGPIITSNVIIQQKREEVLMSEEAPKFEETPSQAGLAKQQISIQGPQNATPAVNQIAQTIKIIPSMDPSKIVEEDVEVSWQFLCDWRGCPK